MSEHLNIPPVPDLETSPSASERLKRFQGRVGKVAVGAAFALGLAVGGERVIDDHNADSTHTDANPTEISANGTPTEQVTASDIGYEVRGDIKTVGADLALPFPNREADPGSTVAVEELVRSGDVLSREEKEQLTTLAPAEIDATTLGSAVSQEESEPTTVPVDGSTAVEEEPAAADQQTEPTPEGASGPIIVARDGESTEPIAEDAPVIVEHDGESTDTALTTNESLTEIGVYIQPGEDVSQAFALIVAQAGYPNVSSDQLFAICDGLVADPSIGPSGIFTGATLEFNQTAGWYQIEDDTVVEAHLTTVAAEQIVNALDSSVDRDTR